MPKYRKMLNEWEAPYIQALVEVVETQSKTTLANWVIDYSENVLLSIWYKHNPVAQASARVIGQSASTIPSATHCMGLALYGSLAVAYDALGIDYSWEQLEQYAGEEYGRILDTLKAIAVENESNPAKLNWNC